MSFKLLKQKKCCSILFSILFSSHLISKPKDDLKYYLYIWRSIAVEKSIISNVEKLLKSFFILYPRCQTF